MGANAIERARVRRRTILDVAGKAFLEHGYGAASMAQIADCVGGSKATLYRYYKSKERLFEAYIEDVCSRSALGTINYSGEYPSLFEYFVEVGVRSLEIILSEYSVNISRLIVSEAHRLPNVGRIFYLSGPLALRDNLEEIFKGAFQKCSSDTADHARAAESFLSSLYGWMHLKRILNISPAPSETMIRVEVEKMVEVFIRAWGFSDFETIRVHPDNRGDFHSADVDAR
jgi:TetR/AcrR family transcriptional repressor of mexJK operon